MITILTKDQIDLLISMAIIIPTTQTERFYHIPNWFKSTEDENTFEVLNINEVPEEIKDNITYYYTEIVPIKLGLK